MWKVNSDFTLFSFFMQIVELYLHICIQKNVPFIFVKSKGGLFYACGKALQYIQCLIHKDASKLVVMYLLWFVQEFLEVLNFYPSKWIFQPPRLSVLLSGVVCRHVSHFRVSNLYSHITKSCLACAKSEQYAFRILGVIQVP